MLSQQPCFLVELAALLPQHHQGIYTVFGFEIEKQNPNNSTSAINLLYKSSCKHVKVGFLSGASPGVYPHPVCSIDPGEQDSCT